MIGEISDCKSPKMRILDQFLIRGLWLLFSLSSFLLLGNFAIATLQYRFSNEILRIKCFSEKMTRLSAEFTQLTQSGLNSDKLTRMRAASDEIGRLDFISTVKHQLPNRADNFSIAADSISSIDPNLATDLETPVNWWPGLMGVFLSYAFILASKSSSRKLENGFRNYGRTQSLKGARFLVGFSWFCGRENREHIELVAANLAKDRRAMRKEGRGNAFITLVIFWHTSTTVFAILSDGVIRIGERVLKIGHLIRKIKGI